MLSLEFSPRCTANNIMHPLISTFNLLLKVRVPDVEFYINVGDWPLETRRGADAVPVLSWCGSTDTRDIILPTYEVTHSTLETMRGVTNDLLSVQGNTGNRHTQSIYSYVFV